MIEPQVLRKAQLIMLDMLIEFDAVCKRNQLQYWLDSGTLLGAVRHQVLSLGMMTSIFLCHLRII